MVPAEWKTEEMEVLVPYIIASHLLYDLARAKEEQTVLILPPIGNVITKKNDPFSYCHL